MKRTTEDAWEFVQNLAETPCNHHHEDTATDCAYFQARRFTAGDHQGATAATSIVAFGRIEDLVTTLAATRLERDNLRAANHELMLANDGLVRETDDLRRDLDRVLRDHLEPAPAPNLEPVEPVEPRYEHIQFNPWTGRGENVRAIVNYIGTQPNGATTDEIGSTFYKDLDIEQVADKLNTIAEQHPHLGLVQRTATREEEGKLVRHMTWKVDAVHLARQTIDLSGPVLAKHNGFLRAALTSVEDVQQLARGSVVLFEDVAS